MNEEYVTREEFEQRMQELHVFFTEKLRELETAQTKEIARLRAQLDVLAHRVRELEMKAAQAQSNSSLHLQ